MNLSAGETTIKSFQASVSPFIPQAIILHWTHGDSHLESDSTHSSGWQRQDLSYGVFLQQTWGEYTDHISLLSVRTCDETHLDWTPYFQTQYTRVKRPYGRCVDRQVGSDNYYSVSSTFAESLKEMGQRSKITLSVLRLLPRHLLRILPAACSSREMRLQQPNLRKEWKHGVLYYARSGYRNLLRL